MYRQGDIMLRSVERIPSALKKVPLDKGRVILAYGEVTGHAHAVIGDVELFLAADVEDLEQRFLHVEAEQFVEVPVFEHRSTGRIITPASYVDEETGDMITPAPYGETEAVQVGTRRVEGASVVHDEHDTITLPPGDYEVVRQREYQPEAPQWVAD
jgi:hypothetical protein